MTFIAPFRALLPRTEIISHADSFFTQAKEQFGTLVGAGYFKPAAQDAMYVYRIEAAWHTHIGLLASADIAAYADGKIIKHEQTLAAKEEKTMRLMQERKAMIKPVLLTYPTVNSITELLNGVTATQKPLYKINFKGITHTLWAVENSAESAAILDLFTANVPKMYIADGHHRMAAVQRRWNVFRAANATADDTKYRQILVALFAAEQLQIWDYNRIIEGLGQYSPLTFLAAISKICNIEVCKTAARPTKPHQFAMYLSGDWFMLEWRTEVLAEVKTTSDGLDVSLLNKKILAEILAIKDIRTDTRVQYCEGIRGLDALAVRGSRQPTVSFCMFPVALQDLMQISDEGETMPPKSTWFEPRIKNGFVAMSL